MSETIQAVWRAEADCQSCAVRSSVLFRGLEPRHLMRIHDAIEEFELPRDGFLYRAGDPGEAVFTVQDGLVKLVQYLADGHQRIVRLVRATDVAGLEALLGQHYQHDAVVLQKATVCRIPIRVIRELEADTPELRQELMCRWQRALTEADAWLTELSTGSARQRVARLLLRLVDAQGQGLCELFGREDIGAMLGITTETASRVIAEFKRNGILEEQGPGRFGCRRDALQALLDD